MQSFTIEDKVSFKCAFCGKQCSAGFVRKNAATVPEPVIVHAMPHCTFFQEMSMTAFLQAGRLAN